MLHTRCAEATVQLDTCSQVVLVGSDIPGIEPAILESAFRALDSHQLVLGPACDGGFYLIGATAVPLGFLQVCHLRPYIEHRCTGMTKLLFCSRIVI